MLYAATDLEGVSVLAAHRRGAGRRGVRDARESSQATRAGDSDRRLTRARPARNGVPEARPRSTRVRLSVDETKALLT